MSAMTNQNEPETTTLGTLGWVGVVVVGAIFALLLLSWLGPVGGH